jgi:hypothetical protein
VSKTLKITSGDQYFSEFAEWPVFFHQCFYTILKRLKNLYRIISKLTWLVTGVVRRNTRFQWTILVIRAYENSVPYVKSYRALFFLDVFISFCSTQKCYQTTWKLIWLTIRLIDENSWLLSSVWYGIYVKAIDYVKRRGCTPNNCNRANSTRKQFKTSCMTVLPRRNWISRQGRFHRLSTPLLFDEKKVHENI